MAGGQQETQYKTHKDRDSCQFLTNDKVMYGNTLEEKPPVSLITSSPLQYSDPISKILHCEFNIISK